MELMSANYDFLSDFLNTAALAAWQTEAAGSCHASIFEAELGLRKHRSHKCPIT